MKLITVFLSQNDLATQLQKEKDANLRSINSQLLLLEANLRRRQEDLSNLIRDKDITIRNQHRLILALASAYSQVTGHSEIMRILTNTNKDDPDVDLPKILKEILASIAPNESLNKEKGTEKQSDIKTSTETTDKAHEELSKGKEEKTIINEEISDKNESNTTKSKEEENLTALDSCSIASDKKIDGENINDTDSAIMLEDTCSDSLVILPFMKEGVKVIRSVSDALECGTRPLQIAPQLEDTTTSILSPPYTPPITSTRSSSEGTPRSFSSTPTSSSSEDNDSSPIQTLEKSLSQLPDSSKPSSNEENFLLNFNSSEISTDNFSLNSNLLLDSTQALSSGSPRTNNSHSTPKLGKSLSVDLGRQNSLECQSLTSSQCDSDSTLSDGGSDSESDDIPSDHYQDSPESPCCPDRRLLLGSFEKLSDIGMNRPFLYKNKKPDDRIQVTYNRVMSNHRSVTKVKDVKYKRINKAKSRSLEELRGKLRVHEPKPLISVSIGHSFA